MINRNTLTVKTYIALNLIGIVISIVWFKEFSFIYFTSLSYNLAFGLNILMLLVNVTLGLFLTINERRNYMSLFVNIILVYELSMAITVFSYFNIQMKYFSLLIMIISCSYCYLMFFRGSKTKILRKSRMNKEKIICSVLGARTSITFGLLLFVVPTYVSLIFDFPTSNNSEPVSISSISKEYKVTQWEKELEKLEQETWETLTITEKLDLAQTVANIERIILGIPTQLNVVSKPLDDDRVQGYYSDEQESIVIDSEHLEKATSSIVVNIICHEAYRAYQYRQVDVFSKLSKEEKELLMFEDVKEYKETFDKGYITAEEDYDAYFEQKVEIDARDHSISRLTYYFYE